ncbi:hypothetical protein [Loigolactobacillus backii]|uniref:Uncharacterized protein n=1 Tax=Loigolactobacillus backii TaxID=375175 RepID=A0A192H1V2_9LACO|nr:hypothetical protein [Loigolactobacillus backii]ANK60341.1 hypothetical protein AYR52_08815 [Loigolactobacillus backii]ANK62217.1 hypothetical protein AYR53_05185 [Loigolactobacillus backii]ANK65222.1 hypothetical protein AYR54_08220 [Loigolactobacillus backii]ANK67780.1 hypothetical protein AYR55_08825 [Loigolactobacillus backii]ANK70768.1 hypothetical protein AYR56_11800 [Loigolactobacillus backii]
MQNFRINFTNKVRTDRVVIGYTATTRTQDGRQRIIYHGEQDYYRDVVPLIFLESGAAAVEAIGQVIKGIDTDYVLSEVIFAVPQNTAILTVPSFMSFTRYLTDNGYLSRVLTHATAEGQIVDTKFSQELRLG